MRARTKCIAYISLYRTYTEVTLYYCICATWQQYTVLMERVTPRSMSSALEMETKLNYYNNIDGNSQPNVCEQRTCKVMPKHVKGKLS